jgi:hypothetical protein
MIIRMTAEELGQAKRVLLMTVINLEMKKALC